MTTRIVLACFLVAAIVGSASILAESGNGNAAAEIEAVLHAQQEAWNRGDIDQFMNGYWRSEETVFVSGDEVTRGWQALAQNSELAG